MTKKETTKEINYNRANFLFALRSGHYPKGTIITDDKGRPIIRGPKDEGFCAVGLMYTLFTDPDLNPNPVDYRKALGLTTKQTAKVQQIWNDSPLTFPEIATLVEKEMFSQ